MSHEVDVHTGRETEVAKQVAPKSFKRPEVIQPVLDISDFEATKNDEIKIRKQYFSLNFQICLRRRVPNLSCFYNPPPSTSPPLKCLEVQISQLREKEGFPSNLKGIF